MGAPLLPHTPGIVIPALCRDPVPGTMKKSGPRHR
jgi:hypothetical protein